MKFILILFLFFLTSTANAKVNIIFLGLTGNNAPSLEKGFEKLLREKLTIDKELGVIDYLECQRYRKVVKFDEFQTVSQNNLETLLEFTNNSSIILWGTVKSFHVFKQRKNFIFSETKAELIVGLHVYSQPLKDYLFIGNINAIQYKQKKLSFFKKLDPVSATDRSDLIEMVQNEAAEVSNRIITAAIKTNAGNDTRIDSDENQNREPSITDVFSIPSIEPAQIESIAPENKDKTDKK